MTPLYRLVTGRPWAVLAVVLALTVGAALGVVDPRSGALRIEVDPSLSRLLPADDPDVQFYRHVREVFGNDEIVLVVLEAHDVYQPEVLGEIARASEGLARVDGVSRVLSLATAFDVRGVEGDLLIEPFLEPLPATLAEAARVREAVGRNPIYRDLLVSADGRAAALLVYLREIPDRELVARGIDREIRQAVEEGLGEDPAVLGYHVTGTPIVKVALTHVLLSDLARTLPLVFALGMLVLVVAFRSVHGVLIPTVTIAVALVWTVGVAGWFGASLNLVTAIVPPLVVTVGFSDAIHVVAEYGAVLRKRGAVGPGGRAEVALEGLRDVGLAVTLMAGTTGAGFLSLVVNRMPAVREFGTLALVGVVATVVASLTLTPALLVLTGPRKARPETPQGQWLQRFSTRLGAFDLRWRGAIVAAGLAVFAVSVFGATRIHVGTDYVANFPEDSLVRRDYAAVSRLLRGSEPFYVVFESSVPDAFADPANLAVVHQFQEWLEAQPEVDSTTSVVDYLMLLNREMSGGDPAAYALPASQRATKQIFMFGSTEEARVFVDAPWQSVNVLVRASVPDSQAVQALVERVEARLSTLPEYVKGTATGDIVLLNRAVGNVVGGQAQSLALAMGIIFAVLAVLFTSLRAGLIALFPNVLPTAVYFGALGLMGVTLNPSTSLVASITLGIAMDDTLLYLTRFNSEARRLADERKATVEALHGVIAPNTFTLLGLCLGFLALLTSDLRSQAEFGGLAAFTLAVAWLSDLTVTPALASRMRIVTLWDVMTLDLGPAPQETIPLFRGLSRRQARIFALLSNLQEIPAGARLIREGESGDEMYVILDGTLVASLTRDGERRELSRMKRGDVVGEVAIFAARRSADVDAASDARLLRFGQEDLARITRRYPRIAAAVYRNLNEVQARRLLYHTERIR